MMNIESVPIDSVVPDPANVRLHSLKNIAAIKGSLMRFGQQRPIIISKDNVIRAGNGTWLAAKEIGWTEIQVTRTDLLGVEAIAFAIADNRTSELAEWDYQALATTLKSLQDEKIDLERLGWEPHDLEPLLAAEWSPPPIEDGVLEESKDPEPTWIEVDLEERIIFDKAAQIVRDKSKAPDLSDGEALKKICSFFIERSIEA